jgi:leucyl/phenylalanyl-tRNA---protein transferase
VHVSRSLARTLRRCGWTTTVDADMEAVIAGCAAGRGDEGTWITPQMARAYLRLHDLGWAHSLEVWDGDDLVGGIYGVQVGGVFTGESMFHRVADASKVALLDLATRFREAGGELLDVQLVTPHLARLGAREVARSHFLELLEDRRDDDVRLLLERLAVARLAPR